jgi:carbonic anhydrase/acetyltransferase-like protein (isoleucine patch superfamily)
MIFALGDEEPRLDDAGNFVAANATLIGKVELQAGASVWFSAVLRGDNETITVGRNSNVQDGSILHTDPGCPLTIGDNVTVGHRVMLHGCTIGDGSLIGIGSTVLNKARIGKQCLVGAHSLITEGKEFPDGVLILGSPARVQRELTDSERAQLQKSADTYVSNGQRYLAGLRKLSAG